MKQKFFFPLNYNYSGKIFGIIEYKLLLPITIYGITLYAILKDMSLDILTKIVIFIMFFLPVVLMLNSHVNSEPFYQFILAIMRHYLTCKTYLYKRVIWCGINPNCKK